MKTLLKTIYGKYDLLLQIWQILMTYDLGGHILFLEVHTDHVSKLFALHWVMQNLFNSLVIWVEGLQILRGLKLIEVLALEFLAILEAILLHFKAAYHRRLVVEAHLRLKVLEKEAAPSFELWYWWVVAHLCLKTSLDALSWLVVHGVPGLQERLSSPLSWWFDTVVELLQFCNWLHLVYVLNLLEVVIALFVKAEAHWYLLVLDELLITFFVSKLCDKFPNFIVT